MNGMDDVLKQQEQGTFNSWALILGGSSGLGLATAKKLAAHGYNIFIVHRDRRSDMEDLESDFDGIRKQGVQLKAFNRDALNSDKRIGLLEEISAILSDRSKISVLVHSIAKGSLKPMKADKNEGLTSVDIQLTFEAMALSLYDWTKALLSKDLFAADTRIIAFTSEGNTRALPHYGAVSVAKVALEALVRNMALEFAPLGIKANCIQAGITKTRSFEMIPGSEAIEANALLRNPNGRLTTPEDVANVVYLLTRKEAEWITGSVIKVDGGESLK
jgi:enoyl-[acyl-carrier protein] reductase I